MKKRLWAGLAVGVMMLGIAGVASAAPIEWAVADGGNGHSYEFISAPFISWTEANNQANAMSGYLATITSAAENSFIYSSVIAGAPSIWLGGFQQAGAAGPTDGWQWVTGETWAYTNWATGEPNDWSGQGENVLISWSDEKV